MTSKEIDKDELSGDLEATEEEAENVTGGLMEKPFHPDHPMSHDRHL